MVTKLTEEEKIQMEKRIEANKKDSYKNFYKNTSIWVEQYDLQTTFKIREGNKKVLELVEVWLNELAERNKTHHFLLLSGGCGRGKTHIALGIVNEWIKRYTDDEVADWNERIRYFNNRIHFYQVADLLNTLRNGYNDETYQRTIDKCYQADLLVLDDLGMQKNTDWAIEQLDMIIDYRYLHERETVFTTNLRLEDLPERIASRLSEATTALITGEDYRKIKAELRKGK